MTSFIPLPQPQPITVLLQTEDEEGNIIDSEDITEQEFPNHNPSREIKSISVDKYFKELI